MENNPLNENWTTPRQTPPFSRIRTEHFAPAIRQAISEASRNIEKIANENADGQLDFGFIERMEVVAERLDRAVELMLNLNECDTTPELQQTVMELMPEITRFEDSIWMDERLFRRVDAIFLHRNELSLSEEQRQVVEKYHHRFVSGGVGLDSESKKRFSEISEQLSVLTEQFGANALHDTNAFTLHITNPADLEGLPEGVVSAARQEADSRNLKGWIFTLHAPSYRPFMTYAANRQPREQMWRAYNSRGNHGGENDNNVIIRQIVNLRLEQVKLLGYNRYSDYKLGRTMARDTDTVTRFLDNLRQACLPYAKSDLDEVRQYAKQSGADFELQNWDFSYYSEKLKQARYGFDSELLRPYLPLDQVRQGIFDLYGTLYGICFVENTTIEKYHKDVRTFEVYDGERFMGVLYLDMFPRAGKRSGAWMTGFRSQSNLDGNEVRPLVQVVCNFTPPTATKPSLLSFDELRTFMHEMGHAMHSMLSDVHYPSLSGTSVPRDFVEMPSQVMENWCLEPEFLNTFAHHYQSGELIPTEYIEKIKRADTFLSGWLCLRQLNFGTVDMAYHTLTQMLSSDLSIERFEDNAMTQLLPVIDGCCSSTSFTHIFDGGYAAGYYGYKWAEVLDADIFSRFKNDGIFNRDTASAFRNLVLSRGGSKNPADLFRDFMGREPDPDALLRRCGFK